MFTLSQEACSLVKASSSSSERQQTRARTRATAPEKIPRPPGVWLASSLCQLPSSSWPSVTCCACTVVVVTSIFYFESIFSLQSSRAFACFVEPLGRGTQFASEASVQGVIRIVPIRSALRRQSSIFKSSLSSFLTFTSFAAFTKPKFDSTFQSHPPRRRTAHAHISSPLETHNK